MKEEKIEELERIIDSEKVELPLYFVIKLMKALEIAQNDMEQGTVQNDLVGNYANTINHEINNFITNEELSIIEESGLL